MEDRILLPGVRTGCTEAPVSKSCVHRILICAALSVYCGYKDSYELNVGETSDDIRATAACLNSLCAEIEEKNSGVFVVRKKDDTGPGMVELPCGESGSTLRFLLPVCGALGVNAVFRMRGRLPERPVYPLDEQLRLHGMVLYREDDSLFCSGKLENGDFTVPGDISSQFISALMFALPLLNGDSRIIIEKKIESSSYISMTEHSLINSGICFQHDDNKYHIPGDQRYSLNPNISPETDWSNAAPFLVMGALSKKGITVCGLNTDSMQGDREILAILRDFGADVKCEDGRITVKRKLLKGCDVNASEIPDLIPAISVLAAAAEGDTQIRNASRLRLKESDRLRATADLIRSLGGTAEEKPDGLLIRGRPECSTGVSESKWAYPLALDGGYADTYHDHRIAMAAAAAACVSRQSVIISDSACVRKSFPGFWEKYAKLEIE